MKKPQNIVHYRLALAVMAAGLVAAAPPALADIRVGARIAAAFVRGEAFTAEIDQVEVQNVPLKTDRELIIITFKKEGDTGEHASESTVSFSGSHLGTGRMLAGLLGRKIEIMEFQNQYVRSETWPVSFKILR